jgi:hypothetical protein
MSDTKSSGGEGHWVTINGAHVKINGGGGIVDGPARLRGKTVAEAESSAHAEPKAMMPGHRAEVAKLKDSIDRGHATIAEHHERLKAVDPEFEKDEHDDLKGRIEQEHKNISAAHQRVQEIYGEHAARAAKAKKAPAAASAPTETQGYLLPVAAGRSTLVPMGLEGFPSESEGQPIEYRRKEVSINGRVLKDVKGRPFPITKDRLDKWVTHFNQMSANGMRVPIQNKHFNVTADDTRGYVVKLERDGERLYAVEQLIGPDAILAASRNDQSVFIDVNVRDDRGNVYDEAITHIAFTATPQVTGLSGYAKVAASRGAVVDAVVLHQATPQHRSFSMNAELSKKLRAKLGVADDVGDEQLAEQVGARFLADAETLAAVTRERDTAVAASRQQAPAPVAASMTPEMVGDLHEIATGKINLAVERGDLPSAIAERLKESLAKDGKPAPVAMSRSDVTNGKEPWRYVLDLFGGLGLGPKVTGQPKTGPQGAPVAASRPDPDGAPDAEKTAADARAEGERRRKEMLAARGIPA